MNELNQSYSFINDGESDRERGGERDRERARERERERELKKEKRRLTYLRNPEK